MFKIATFNVHGWADARFVENEEKVAAIVNVWRNMHTDYSHETQWIGTLFICDF